MEKCWTVTLPNGVVMPMLGLGTSKAERAVLVDAVRYAVDEEQCRLVDTAKRYGNEDLVGDALQGCRCAQNEVFLTTKLWPGDAGNVYQAFRTSVQRLGLTPEERPLDLYLVHWPGAWGSECTSASICKQVRQDTWRSMEGLLEKGLCRAIGVSNFLRSHLQDVEETAAVQPMVNQIEFNPFQNPKSLVEYCVECGIQVEGYCPLAKGCALEQRSAVELSQKYDCSVAQLLIRWSLQKGVVTIPKSVSPARIHENFDVFDNPMFPIQEGDMEKMEQWHCNLRVTWDPTDVL